MSTSQKPKIADLRPKKVNILLWRADGWKIPMTFKPGGTPVDITGYTIRAQCRESADATEFTELTIEITDAPNGKFVMSQAEAGQIGYYDVEITPPAPNDIPRTYIWGALEVDKDYTHE